MVANDLANLGKNCCSDANVPQHESKVMKSEFFDGRAQRDSCCSELGVRPEISAGYFVTAWCCDDEVGHFGGRAFVGGRAAGLRWKRLRAQR